MALLVINGTQVKCPATYSVVSTQAVDAGRNVNGAVVGQLVGRRQYKINNLQWNGIKTTEWAKIINAIKPFYVPVTFVDDTNTVRTITMYPGDTEGQPLLAKDDMFEYMRSGKFNLIDCGWD